MIYVFFPVFAAICYGLAIIYDEKALETVNVATLVLFSTVMGIPLGIATAFALSKAKNQSFNFDFLHQPTVTLYATLGLVLVQIAVVFTLFAIQKTSASYTAFAEISYPFFTILFLVLFFGVRQFNWSILFGGGLVLLGSFILIYGQMRQMS